MGLLLQITQAVDSLTSSSDIIPEGEELSLLELAAKGGPIMIPIALCSVLAIYIIVERYVAIKKSSKTDANFMNNIRDFIHTGNMDAAKALCKNTDNPIARMIEKGINRIGKPLSDIEKAIENTGNIEVVKMEKGLSLLATVAGAAPMLGFLGTVTGMIKAFYNMSKAGNTIEIGVLSGGMYEAMTTTVAGLIVGIIALVSYNLLAAMVERVVFHMESSSIEFMDLLQEPAK